MFNYQKFGFLKYLPNFLIEFIFGLLNFISYDLEMNFLGYEKFNFGNVMLYDLTESGITEAFFPLPK